MYVSPDLSISYAVYARMNDISRAMKTARIHIIRIRFAAVVENTKFLSLSMIEPKYFIQEYPFL